MAQEGTVPQEFVGFEHPSSKPIQFLEFGWESAVGTIKGDCLIRTLENILEICARIHYDALASRICACSSGLVKNDAQFILPLHGLLLSSLPLIPGHNQSARQLDGVGSVLKHKLHCGCSIKAARFRDSV